MFLRIVFSQFFIAKCLICHNNDQEYLFYSTAQHGVLNWQRHAARRMVLHFLEVDAFYQVSRKVNKGCANKTHVNENLNMLAHFL